jgi:hypothetical protein
MCYLLVSLFHMQTVKFTGIEAIEVILCDAPSAFFVLSEQK